LPIGSALSNFFGKILHVKQISVNNAITHFDGLVPVQNASERLRLRFKIEAQVNAEILKLCSILSEC
jgi:nitrogen fixation protein FixH